MEKKESKKIDDYKKQTEMKKPSLSGKGVLFSGKGDTNRFSPPKVETVNPFGGQKNNLVAGMNKPIFVNKTEEKPIPQPPQLAKKPQAEFVKKEEPVKKEPENKEQKPEDKQEEKEE